MAVGRGARGLVAGARFKGEKRDDECKWCDAPWRRWEG